MRRSFTFIELLISLAVIAVAFLPLMHMFTTGLEQVYHTAEMDTARYLAQEAMERLRNLNFTEEQIKALGYVWTPPLTEPAYEMNGGSWRVAQKVKENSDPLEVSIAVFREPIMPASRPVIELVTLIEDLDWTE